LLAWLRYDIISYYDVEARNMGKEKIAVINLRQSRRLDKDVNRSKRLKTVSYLKVATHRTS